MAKKLLSSLLLAVTCSLLLVTPVLAFLYRAPITITENASTAYAMLPVMWNSANSWIAANGFMNLTASGTRVQTLGGLNKPRMVADNKTLTAIPVLADSQTNLFFATGESAAATMNIIVGNGGYITVIDNNALELGGNFSMSYSGYVDTSSAENILYKKHAFSIYAGGGNITVSVLAAGAVSWISPTATDNGTGWTAPSNSWDGNTATFAQQTVGAGGTTTYLVLGRSPAAFANQIRFWANWAQAGPSWTVDTYNGTWGTVYGPGTPTQNNWTTQALAGWQYISAVRIRAGDTSGLGDTFQVHEIQLGEAADSVTLSTTQAVTPGVRDVYVAGSAGVLAFSVDSVFANVGGFTSVPGTNANWTLFPSDATPYTDNLTISVNETRQLYFAPNNIIAGTNLPDREPNGGSNNGTITWGANPAGVGVTLGSFTSSGQPDIGGVGDTSTDDILPIVGGTDWRPVPGVSAALLANPMRPVVTAISDNTTLSEYQVWVWFGIIFVVFTTVLVGSHVRGHHLITGIAASAAIVLLVVWTIFPLLALLVVVLAILLGLVSERSPSL